MKSTLILLLFPFSIYSLFENCRWPTNGLVALYSFDNNYDDVSVNNRTSVLHGAEIPFKVVSGDVPFSKSIYASEIDQHIIVGDSESLLRSRLSGEEGLGVSFWTRLSQAADHYDTPISKGISTSSNDWYVSWDMYDHFFRVHDCRFGLLRYRDSTTPSPYSANEWHHLVFSTDDTNELMIFIDGESIPLSPIYVTDSTPCSLPTPQPIIIGSPASSFVSYHGEIACVHLYNLSINVTEASLLYEDGCSCFVEADDNAEDYYWTKHIQTGNRHTELVPKQAINNDDIWLLGSTYYFSTKSRIDLMAMKLSPFGETLMLRGYGERTSSGEDDLGDLKYYFSRILRDDSVVLVGCANLDGSSDLEDDGMGQPFAVRLFENGTISWAKYFKENSIPNGYIAGVGEDGSDNIVLYFTTEQSGVPAVQFIRVTIEGELYSVEKFYSDDPLYPTSINCNEVTKECYGVGRNGFILKFPSSFTLEFSKYVRDGTNGNITNILPLHNGAQIIWGWWKCDDEVTYSLYIAIFRWDAGEIMWKKRIVGFNQSSDPSLEPPWRSVVKFIQLVGSGDKVIFKIESEDGGVGATIFSSVYIIFRVSDGSFVEAFELVKPWESHANLLELHDGQYLQTYFPDFDVKVSRFVIGGQNCSEDVQIQSLNHISFVDFTELDQPGDIYDIPGATISSQSLSLYTSGDLEINELYFEEEEDSGTIIDEFTCYLHHIWCYGITRVNSSVCSGHGSCDFQDSCSCSESYNGDECESYQCFGYEWNDPLVCSLQNGSCDSVDNCTCFNGYSGSKCDEWDCDHVPSTDTINVCNGHGACIQPEICVCEQFYNDTEYCDWSCFKINSEESYVCDDHGVCVGYNNCSCENGYRGLDCEIVSCFGIYLDDVENEICGGHGNCIYLDSCHCDSGYSSSSVYSDGICDNWFCGSYFKNDTEVCNNRGNCTSSHKCECKTGYYGDLCEEYSCGVFSHTESTGCNDHGICIASHVCDCDEGYIEQFCDIWSCNGVLKNQTDEICSGNGECKHPEICTCEEGYTGEVCQFWRCGEIDKDNQENVCCGNGICVSFDYCECENGYYGDICQDYFCFTIESDDNDVCTAHGECIEPDVCECENGYDRDDCSHFIYLETVIIPVVSVFGTTAIGILILCIVCFVCQILCCLLIICICCICCISVLGGLSLRQKLKLKKFDQLDEVSFDLILKEQELEKDTSMAHIRINKHLFEIEYESVRIKKILGEGGSKSIVYLAKWSGKKVAFKCFRTRSICSSQDKFDEFESEVEIMSSISHPNIIRFFGSTLKPPRVGIVMEFCAHGEILEYLKNFRSDEDEDGYPLDGKIRMMIDICSGMNYLHSKGVIHRDLKCENVLLDENNVPKIMDFGISKLTKDSDTPKTRRVGTSFYMAPEVAVSDKYTEKCDVFSFAIMMYVIITEDPYPYGNNNFNVELKVASDEMFRPDLENFEEKLNNDNYVEEDSRWNEKESKDLLKNIMVQCWDVDPKLRFDFKSLISRLESSEETDSAAFSKKKRERIEKKYNNNSVEELKRENIRLKKEVERLRKEREEDSDD